MYRNVDKAAEMARDVPATSCHRPVGRDLRQHSAGQPCARDITTLVRIGLVRSIRVVISPSGARRRRPSREPSHCRYPRQRRSAPHRAALVYIRRDIHSHAHRRPTSCTIATTRLLSVESVDLGRVESIRMTVDVKLPGMFRRRDSSSLASESAPPRWNEEEEKDEDQRRRDPLPILSAVASAGYSLVGRPEISFR